MVRTRIAPAPSGRLHLGTAHTALFNYLFAKHNQGTFILRIDDSDPKRSDKKFEADIFEGFNWLGLKWDEGPDIDGPYPPYRQSEARDRYQPYIDKLLQSGKTYECFCTDAELAAEHDQQLKQKLAPRYSSKCRNLTTAEKQALISQGKKYAVRFKTEPRTVTFHDPTRGNISVHTDAFGDFVLARNDGSPLLVLATTIDDIVMKITHTIRGEDFLNLVPKQILLFEALGETPPVFAHLHFIHGPDKQKLSKRHGAKAVVEYKEEGYLPEAMVTFLAYMSWSYKDNSELLSIDKLIQEFELNKVKNTNPIFDQKKLDYFNGKAIRAKSDQELFALLKPHLEYSTNDNTLLKIIPLIKERIITLKDANSLIGFFFSAPKIPPELGKLKTYLVDMEPVLKGVEWKKPAIEAALLKLVGDKKYPKTEFFMSLRLAVCGQKITPPLTESMLILGREEVISRLQYAQKSF